MVLCWPIYFQLNIVLRWCHLPPHQIRRIPPLRPPLQTAPPRPPPPPPPPPPHLISSGWWMLRRCKLLSNLAGLILQRISISIDNWCWITQNIICSPVKWQHLYLLSNSTSMSINHLFIADLGVPEGWLISGRPKSIHERAQWNQREEPRMNYSAYFCHKFARGRTPQASRPY